MSSDTTGEGEARRQGYAAGYEAGAQSWRVEVEQRDAEIARLQARLEVDPRHSVDGIEARNETIRQQDRELARLRGELQDSRRVVEAMYQRAASAAEQRNGEIARLRAELAECRAEMAETGLEDRGA
jgi:chromosome segregation ATPase